MALTISLHWHLKDTIFLIWSLTSKVIERQVRSLFHILWKGFVFFCIFFTMKHSGLVITLVDLRFYGQLLSLFSRSFTSYWNVLLSKYLFQGSFFMSMFFGLRGMAECPVPSMTTGGIHWFTGTLICLLNNFCDRLMFYNKIMLCWSTFSWFE